MDRILIGSFEINSKSALRNFRFAILLSAMLFALSYSASAQQPKKVFRIGYLSATDRATDAPRSEGVRRALRNLSYIEGQNLVIEYRHAEGKPGRNAELAAELVRLNVDLIVVAGGDGGIQAAMNTTQTIPILMMGQGSRSGKGGLRCKPCPSGRQRHRHYKSFHRPRRKTA